MRGEGTFIRIQGKETREKRKVLICIREHGEEIHLAYPLYDALSNPRRFFRMEVVK